MKISTNKIDHTQNKLLWDAIRNIFKTNVILQYKKKKRKNNKLPRVLGWAWPNRVLFFFYVSLIPYLCIILFVIHE